MKRVLLDASLADFHKNGDFSVKVGGPGWGGEIIYSIVSSAAPLNPDLTIPTILSRFRLLWQNPSDSGGASVMAVPVGWVPCGSLLGFLTASVTPEKEKPFLAAVL